MISSGASLFLVSCSPTVVERWLWISSAIFIDFAGTVPVTVYLTVAALEYMKERYSKWLLPFHHMLSTFWALELLGGARVGQK
jgi:hypothetical protein